MPACLKLVLSSSHIISQLEATHLADRKEARHDPAGNGHETMPHEGFESEASKGTLFFHGGFLI
jgi:hypothetical protein